MKLQVYADIGSRQEQQYLAQFGAAETVLCADSIKEFINSIPPEDNDIELSIHSNGGYVAEGRTIYDLLRTSGKNIYSKVEGNCHSIAVLLNLAAPFQNREANKNATMLVHPVSAGISGQFGSKDLSEMAEFIREEEEAILDIYVDRTTTDRETLRELMENNTTLNAQQMLEYGFISKITDYTTNFKTTKSMNEERSLSQKAQDFLFGRTKNRRNFKTANYEYHDISGNVVFSTPSEEDNLAVGDPVTLADGYEYDEDNTLLVELNDGRRVALENGEVAGIALPDTEAEAALEEAYDQIGILENRVKELESIVNEYKQKTTTNYRPARRQTTNVKTGKPVNTVNREDQKEEARSDFKTFRNKQQGKRNIKN